MQLSIPTRYSWDGFTRVTSESGHSGGASKKGLEHPRSTPRYPFSAGIRVVDLKSGKQIVSVTSNVSRSGCHVRTTTPFEQGTKVTVIIKHQGGTFESGGTVVYAIAGAGMGLHFENEAAEQDALRAWLVLLKDDVIERVREQLTLRKRIIILVFCALALFSAVWLLVHLGALR